MLFEKAEMDVFSPSELSPCNSRVDLSADVISAVENLKELSKILAISINILLLAIKLEQCCLPAHAVKACGIP